MLKPFTKTQNRILLERLEQHYQIELSQYRHYLEHSAHRNKPTVHASVDRKFRLRIKSIELVLCNLGSKLFDDVPKRPSLRQSKTLTHANLLSTHSGKLSSRRMLRPNKRKTEVQISI